VGMLSDHDYTLLSAVGGGLSAGSYSVDVQPGGFTPGTLTVTTDNLVVYHSGTAKSDPLYWNNTQSTGSWVTNNSGATNWVNAMTGGTDQNYTPGAATTVFFSTTEVTGPTINTTLDSAVLVDHVVFTANPNGVTNVVIDPGTGGSLIIAPGAAGGTGSPSDGID